ncbi:MFS transporter [Streptomyces sp. NPDC093109]|uniref:MFS transporter n=1 Tax=Streptomyces sp. NPDC093109 TaxID=3154977 RepID=UPI00344B794B
MSQSRETSDLNAAVRQRRAMIGAFAGTAVEWYDFFIFGTAAALVFGKVFYPDVAPGAALLASFATLWVGFLARPLGGVVFGHFGDKWGRKNTLVITLILMGVATTGIGLLPTHATIGVAAPILLVVLRALQGMAVGGEWGGAVLIATENARPGKRGLAGAWVQQGSPAGAIMASLVFMLVSRLPEEQFLTWGWRLPFLLSAVLVVVGLVVRLKLEESPDFVETQRTRAVVKTPVVTVFREVPATVVIGIAASVIGISLAYFTNTFLLAWTTGRLGIERQTMLLVLLAGAVLQFILQPLAPTLARRWGANRVMVGGLVCVFLLVPPFFLAIQAANVVAIAITTVLFFGPSAMYYALLASQMSAAFPAHVRYTGVSMSYQLCSSLIGGSTPFIAQAILNGSDGNPWGVAVFLGSQVLITILGVVLLSRRSKADVSPPVPVAVA